MADTPTQENIEKISMAEFLESTPPNTIVRIEKVLDWHPKYRQPGNFKGLNTPEIQLHCSSEKCNGHRFFLCVSPASEMESNQQVNRFVVYRCRNCQETEKIFAISAMQHDEDVFSEAGTAMKFGEYPAFGPPTPARLIKLIGPDREAFLSGRRCENQGLGIGAFVYYRRVIENQKTRILQEIRKVALKVGAKAEAIQLLVDAEKEIQFTRAMDMAKPALPESLLISGQNPLGLLHAALSEGVHALTDDECLSIAGSIRVVMGELSERLASALKDEEELKSALSVLLNREKHIKTSTPPAQAERID